MQAEEAERKKQEEQDEREAREWSLNMMNTIALNWMDRVRVVESKRHHGQLGVVVMFEFMIPAMQMNLMDDEVEHVVPRRRNVTYEQPRPATAKAGEEEPSFWTTPIPPEDPDNNQASQSPVVRDTLRVLLTIMTFKFPCHSKMMQLAIQALWAYALRHRNMEPFFVDNGLTLCLLAICQHRAWPPALHAAAAGLLGEMLDEWRNLLVFGEDNLMAFVQVLVDHTNSQAPRKESMALRMLGHLTSVAPHTAPNPPGLVAFCKDTVRSCKGVEVIAGVLTRKLRAVLTGSEHPESPKELPDAAPKQRRHSALQSQSMLWECCGHLHNSEEEEEQEEELDKPPEHEVGVLAVMAHALRVLRNLSTRKRHRVHIAKTCLSVCLRISSVFAACGPGATEQEEDIQNLAACVLSNLATDPDNRTRFYKAELKGSVENAWTCYDTIAARTMGAGTSPRSLRCERSPSPPRSPPRGGAKDARSTWPQPPRTAVTRDLSASVELAGIKTGGVLPSVPRPSDPHHASAQHQMLAVAKLSRPKVFFPPVLLEETGGVACAGEESTRKGSPKKFNKKFPKESTLEHLQWMQDTFAEEAETMRRAREKEYGELPQVFDRNTLEQVPLTQLRTAGGSTRYPPGADSDDDWEEGSRAMPYLAQTLRRPLTHAWRATMEGHRCRGKNRWDPSISEYHEPSYPEEYSPVASRLLGTTLGRGLGKGALADMAEVSQLVKASQPPPLKEKLTLARPETRERSNGKQALVTLEPHTIQRYKPVEPGTKRSVAIEDKKPLILRVQVAPKRNKQVITFRKKQHDDEGSEGSAKLVMFEHFKGSKVYQGLFPEYSLPNGLTTHYYYTMGSLVEEVEVMVPAAPDMPNTLVKALQPGIPLDIKLDTVTKPAGPFDEVIALYKPTPPLPPLPLRHTLDVVDSTSLAAEAFGDLKQTPLKLAALAVKVVKRTTQEKREEIKVEVKEPWSLPKSIFRERTKVCDSKGFFDSQKVEDAVFENDWANLTAKEKFTSAMAREAKNSDQKLTEEKNLALIKDMIKKKHKLLRKAFMFYAGMGSGDPFCLGLNSYTSFLEESNIPDRDSKQCKRSDCDTLYIVANFSTKDAPQSEGNSDNALARFEFIEAMIRLAVAKYGKGVATNEVSDAIQMILSQNVEPNLKLVANLDPNDFRKDRLYTEECDDLFRKHEKVLRALYSRYRQVPKSGGVRPKMLDIGGWEIMADDLNLISDEFTLLDMRICYLYSRMLFKDEMKDYKKTIHLTFIDFLEALSRMADALSFPSMEDILTAGYESVMQWFLEFTGGPAPNGVKPIPKRASFGLETPKQRPLHLKVDALLTIMYEKLNPDPKKPVDIKAVTAALQQQDHKMGP